MKLVIPAVKLAMLLICELVDDTKEFDETEIQ
jgi:hypothetical protein